MRNSLPPQGRGFTPDDARDAAPFVPMGGCRADWIRALAAGRAAGLPDDELIELSARAPNYGGERATRDTLRSIRAGAVQAGTWFWIARRNGWSPAPLGQRRQQDVPVPRAVVPAEPEQRQHQHETLSPYGRRLWASSVPLAGTIGAQYLKARRCMVPPADGDLRFLPAHRHPMGEFVGPALVALVTDVLTGEPIGLHQTWVREDGTKADTPGPARLLLGGHRKQGGVIRLSPDEAVTTGLGVAEGVETALSLAHAYQPVWALIDAGNLAALPALPGIGHLVIAADADLAGMRAAAECAARWSEAGITSSIVTAGCIGRDLNDTIKEAA